MCRRQRRTRKTQRGKLSPRRATFKVTSCPNVSPRPFGEGGVHQRPPQNIKTGKSQANREPTQHNDVPELLFYLFDALRAFVWISPFGVLVGARFFSDLSVVLPGSENNKSPPSTEVFVTNRAVSFHLPCARRQQP